MAVSIQSGITKSTLVCASITLLLTACGGGGGGSPSTTNDTVSPLSSEASPSASDPNSVSNLVPGPAAESTPSAASGTVYYVDAQNGNDSNNGRSSTSAWRTLDKVANESRNSSVRPNGFLPGDQILFRRGQKFQSAGNPVIKMAGSATAPVVIDVWGQGSAPQFDNTAPGNFDTVLTLDGSYGVVRNLSVIKADAGNKTAVGIKLQGKGHRVTASEISGVGMGVEVYGNDHRVDTSYIHDLSMVVADTTNPDNDYGATAVLLLNASNISVDHNRFERLRAASPDYGYDGSAVEFFNNVSNIKIHNNVAKEINAFTEMGGSSGDVVKSVTYHHNVVVNAKAIGWFHNNPVGTNFGLNISDIRFEHNTFIKNNTDYNGFLLGFAKAPASTDFILRNNVIDYRNTNALFHNPGQMTHTNNLFSLLNATLGNGYGFHHTEVAGNPMFRSTSTGDYRLSAGSMAIDRGASLGYAKDLDGLAMPMGAAPDMGAYESR